MVLKTYGVSEWNTQGENRTDEAWIGPAKRYHNLASNTYQLGEVEGHVCRSHCQ